MPLIATDLEETFICKEEGIKKLLANILILNLQHEPNEKAIIHMINKLLSVAKHRKEGLEYLNLIMTRCSSAIVIENGLSWISHCIVKFPDDVLREIKLQVLGSIIEVAHDQADFNKKFVSDYISKVLDNCITTSYVNNYECKAALGTLVTCMKYYPSWFGQQKQKVEKFILIFLDDENIELVETAALALHYLQQCGGAGANGINHQINFTGTFHKLCRTAHKLYDKFFENESEMFSVDRSDEDTFEFLDDPTQNSHGILHSTATRIRNVYKFIEIAIKIKYPVPKETKPKELLEVIIRVLSFHKCITGNNEESLHTYQFSLQLVELQCAALKLLRLFIVWYQSNSLPFSYTISKAIVDSIERIHNCGCYTVDSTYPEATYRTLCQWLPISKSSLHSKFQSHILECILLDITPKKLQMTLTITDAVLGKTSQKAKRRAMVNRIVSSGNDSGKLAASSLAKASEKTICQFALTALKTLLESSTLKVKTTQLKDLYKSIFDSLLNIQAGNPPDLYTDPQCQTKLYDILVGFYHQNTVAVLPPLHTSLNILKNGANDKNRFVAEICQKGLRMLEMFCQPVCPSLFIGLNKEQNEQGENVLENQAFEDGEMETAEHISESVNFDEALEADEGHTNSNNDFNTSTETTLYKVRYTESDRSTIDDGLSDKGEPGGNSFTVEELHVDAEFKQDEEICVHLVVTAPSEDGNEILEGQHFQEADLDPIQEEIGNECEEKSPENHEPEIPTINIEEHRVTGEALSQAEENIKVAETVESELEKMFSCSNSSKLEEEKSVPDEQAIETSESIAEEALEGNRKRKQAEEEVEEARKKSKVTEEAPEDVGKLDEDPDASYLDEDSFVDEVKNYN